MDCSEISIAKRLADGEIGGGYAEAALLLCGVLSAFATELWPGKRQPDKQRFVQLLISYADPTLETARISVPLLIGYLRDKGHSGPERYLRGREREAGFSSPRVVTGADVDMPESEVAPRCLGVSIRELRNFSYATLLYEEIRCGYAHEYASGNRSSEWIIGENRFRAHVSYLNRGDLPDRQIHFSIPWLIEIVASVEKRSSNEKPSQLFKDWWLPTR